MKHPLDCSVFLSPLRSAEAFYCYARVWWDGAGLDSLAWWSDDDRDAHHICLFTGETITPESPKILRQEIVEAGVLNGLLERFAMLGGFEVEDQHSRIAFLHYDVWFGVKRCHESPKWLGIAGAIHQDSRISALMDDLLDQYPLPLSKEGFAG